MGKAFIGRCGARRAAAATPTATAFVPAVLVLALAGAFAGESARAQPSGAQAVYGSASLSQQGSRLVVTTQNGVGSSHSAINWQSFSVPAGTSTHFQQPSASSLSINRVLGPDPSAIYGTLSSNGRLVLVNPAGIAVGAGAVIDTAGFAASTLRMSDADALAGRLRFGDGSPAGPLSVAGSILARQGDVVLLAPQVQVNAGAVISSPEAATVLAAGQRAEITGRGLEGIVMELQAPADSALNLGRLEGGAVGIFAGTLRHSGDIRAVRATQEGGRVVLRAQQSAVMDGRIDASAQDLGDGGQVLVWSEGSTQVAGALSARGGTQGGNGGSVETSGKVALSVSGATRVDTSAPKGHMGRWLLDPTDLVITADGGSATDSTVYESTIENSLTDVVLVADNTITASGSFTGGLSLPAGRSLSLSADTITLSGLQITTSNDSATGARGAISMTGTSGVSLDNVGLTTAGGDITLASSSGTVSLQASSLSAGPGNILLQGASAGSTANALALTNTGLSTAGGSITLVGQGPVRLDQALIRSDNGPIAITGDGGSTTRPGVDIWGSPDINPSGFYVGAGNLVVVGTSRNAAAPGIELHRDVLLGSSSGSTFSFIGRNTAGGEGLRASTDGGGIPATLNTGFTKEITVRFETYRLEADSDATPLVRARRVELRPLSDRLISLGGTPGSGLAYYSADALARLKADTLAIGGGDLNGGIAVSAATPGASVLSLLQGNGGDITQTVPIAVDKLQASGRSVQLLAGNTVNALSGAAAQGFEFHNTGAGAGSLSVETVDGVAGISAGTMTLDLVPSGNLTQLAPIVASTLNLPQLASVDLSNPGNAFDRVVVGAGVTRVAMVNGSTGASTLELPAGASLQDLNYQAAGTFSLQTPTVSAGQVFLNATSGDLDLHATSFTAPNGITLVAQGGNLSVGSAHVTGPGAELFLSALGSVEAGGSLQADALRVTAGGDIRVPSLSSTTPGGVVSVSTLASMGGSIDMQSSSPLRLTVGATVPAGVLRLRSTSSIDVLGPILGGIEVALQAPDLHFGTPGTQSFSALSVHLTADNIRIGDLELSGLPPTTLVLTFGDALLEGAVTVGQGSNLLVQRRIPTSLSTAVLSSLRLHGGGLNGSADVEVLNDFQSTVPLGLSQASLINGGPGSLLRLKGNSTISGATLVSGRAIRNEGTLSVPGDLRMTSTLSNAGSMLVGGGNRIELATLRNDATGTVTLDGDVRLETRVNNDGHIDITDGNLFMAGGDGITTPISLFFNNSTGVIRLLGTGGITAWDAPTGVKGALFNAGTLIKSGAGTSRIELRQMLSSGLVQLEGGTLGLRSGMLRNAAGDFDLAAGTTLDMGDTNLNSFGTLSGSGTLSLGTGTLTNQGTIAPGGDGQIAGAPLTIAAASVVHGAGAQLHFDIDGSAHDQLAIVGGAAQYDAATEIHINQLSTSPLQTSYTLQSGGAGGTLPTLVDGPAGSTLAFGSLVLNLPQPPAPLAPPPPPPAPAAAPAVAPSEPLAQVVSYKLATAAPVPADVAPQPAKDDVVVITDSQCLR